MFSEGGISAVPIVDEKGFVVNLSETVDVIVSHDGRFDCVRICSLVLDSGSCFLIDSCSTWRLPVVGPDNLRSSEPTVA